MKWQGKPEKFNNYANGSNLEHTLSKLRVSFDIIFIFIAVRDNAIMHLHFARSKI